jgi:hypothetical protein
VPFLIEVRGGPDQLARISRQLKEEANRGMERELNRELRKAAGPFAREVREAAMDRLPNRGGLSRRVARSRVSVRNRSGKGQGVQIAVGARRSQTEQMNRGYVIHPVFGGEQRVRQAIPAGFADVAAKNTQAEVTRGMQEATARVAARIERAGRGL